MSEQIPNSETRPVSSFNKLVLKGVGSVILTQGAQESLVIEADPDIRSRIRSEVRDGTLTISYDFDLISDVFGLRFIGAPPIRYHVSMININGISNSGAGTIQAGPIQSNTFELTMSGVGSVDCQSITAQNLAISLSGAGSIKVQTIVTPKMTVALSGAGSIRIAGRADDQQVRLSGVGSYEAGDLESQIAKASVSGAGSATVWAKNTLDASLTSVGSIKYYGTPSVTSRIDGLGRLSSLGNK
jgi:hypothetical protein